MKPSDAGLILAYVDCEDIVMAVINMAFQRGMPEYYSGEDAAFDHGDRERALDEDVDYFESYLGDLANLAQKWLTDNVAPEGYEFACLATGFYLAPVRESVDAGD